MKDIIILIFVLLVGSIFVIMLTLTIVHNLTGNKWFCKNMGWHRGKDIVNGGFDGCSLTGHCSSCNKDVLQDGQGNWF